MRNRRKHTLLSIVTAIAAISLLWGLAAYSRRTVEVEKNTDLSAQIKKLRTANSVMAMELKQLRNALAMEKKQHRECAAELSARQNDLLHETAKNRDLLQTLELRQQEYSEQEQANRRKLVQLQQANQTLSAELAQRNQDITTLEQRLATVTRSETSPADAAATSAQAVPLPEPNQPTATERRRGYNW